MANRRIEYKRQETQDVSTRDRKWLKEEVEINMVPMNYFLHTEDNIHRILSLCKCIS
jgi:hypothetical protein